MVMPFQDPRGGEGDVLLALHKHTRMANWLRRSKFSALLRDTVKPLMGPNAAGRQTQLTQYGVFLFEQNLINFR
jgi:hypothetical protein